MAEVIWYVDPDATGSGDGDTWENAYTSLSAWEAAEEVDLDTANNWAHVYCRSSGGGDDTTAVQVNGWTTSATDYILIESDDDVGGIWDATKYNLSISGGHCLWIIEDFVRIKGVQIQLTNTAGTIYGCIYVSGGISATTDLRVWNCVIKGVISGSGAGVGIYCRDAVSGYGDLKAWNNLVYDFIGGSGAQYGILSSYFSSLTLWNNTIQNNAVGIQDDEASYCDTIAINTLFSGNTADAVGTFAAGTDYNVTNNASIGYTVTGEGNTHDDVSQTFTFVGDPDFHLDSADVGAKDLGVADPGSGTYSDDVDGDTRSGSWDCGFDEVVGGGGVAFIPRIMSIT